MRALRGFAGRTIFRQYFVNVRGRNIIHPDEVDVILFIPRIKDAISQTEKLEP